MMLYLLIWVYSHFSMCCVFATGTEQQKCGSDCKYAQAGLHVCCSHMYILGFLMTRLIKFIDGIHDKAQLLLTSISWTLFRIRDSPNYDIQFREKNMKSNSL